MDREEGLKCAVIRWALGELTLIERAGRLLQVRFGADTRGALARETPLLNAAITQFNAYFAGEQRSFDLPLDARGTPFQLAVWRALCEIPYGQTRTYGQIAAQAGRPRACRAVGMANHNNPLPIIVPCHRVIGADGGLTGYGGGLDVKRALLKLEADAMAAEENSR